MDRKPTDREKGTKRVREDGRQTGRQKERKADREEGR